MNRIGLCVPFTDLGKKEICNLGQRLQVPFAKTWTCYEGGAVQCGKCMSCQLRQEGFVKAGVIDPTNYR